MNKFFLYICASLILTFPLSAIAEDKSCLARAEAKIIDINHEVVFDTNELCEISEIEEEIISIPPSLYPDHSVNNLTKRAASVEEAIALLKKSKRKNEKTEDLIKLMDFLPSALPAQISILEFDIETIDPRDTGSDDVFNPFQLSFDFFTNSDEIKNDDSNDHFSVVPLRIGVVVINSSNIILGNEKLHKVITITNQ